MTQVTAHVTILYCDILEGLFYRRQFYDPGGLGYHKVGLDSQGPEVAKAHIDMCFGSPFQSGVFSPGHCSLIIFLPQVIPPTYVGLYSIVIYR